MSDLQKKTNQFTFNYWDFKTSKLTSFDGCHEFLYYPANSVIKTKREDKIAFFTNYDTTNKNADVNVWDLNNRQLKTLLGLTVF